MIFEPAGLLLRMLVLFLLLYGEIVLLAKLERKALYSLPLITPFSTSGVAGERLNG